MHPSRGSVRLLVLVVCVSFLRLSRHRTKVLGQSGVAELVQHSGLAYHAASVCVFKESQGVGRNGMPTVQ
jgi:hypothetical protein